MRTELLGSLYEHYMSLMNTESQSLDIRAKPHRSGWLTLLHNNVLNLCAYRNLIRESKSINFTMIHDPNILPLEERCHSQSQENAVEAQWRCEGYNHSLDSGMKIRHNFPLVDQRTNQSKRKKSMTDSENETLTWPRRNNTLTC